MPTRLAVLMLALLTGATGAFAHSYSFDDLKIGHLWSPPPEEGADGMPVYGPLVATGDSEIVIIGASSPDAEQVRFRSNADGAVTWPDRLVLEPGRPLGLAAWREHIWLQGLTHPVVGGDEVTVDLELSDGRHIEVESMVEDAPSD